MQMASRPLQGYRNEMVVQSDQNIVTQRKEKFQRLPVPMHNRQTPSIVVSNVEKLQDNYLSDDLPTGHSFGSQNSSNRKFCPIQYCPAGADWHIPSQAAFGLTPLQELKPIDTTACSVTSSDFLSDDSSPICSPSQSSTKASVGLTKCPCCPSTFQGAPTNQRRNLRRHMFNKHSIDPRLSCPVPTCGQTFGYGRFDNQKRHLSNIHGLST